MKLGIIGLLLAVCLSASSARGQAEASGGVAASLRVGGGLTALHANAQPGNCGCFFMYGGYGQVGVVRVNGLGLVADYGVTSTTNINDGNHNLTLSTFLLGARYTSSWRTNYLPYAQLSVGVGHSASNFIIDQSTTSIAYQLGAGVDYELRGRLGLRLLEVDYLQTHVPNGVNDRQNLTRLTTGVSYSLSRR